MGDERAGPGPSPGRETAGSRRRTAPIEPHADRGSALTQGRDLVLVALGELLE
jgi:hypothetical protein